MAETSRAPRKRRAKAEQTEQQRRNAVLWQRFSEHHEPQVREQLILQYAPLVKYVMGRLAISLPAILDYEDILSSGTIGLIEAVERFDHSKGVKFETYAIARVKGAIIDTLRALDRLPRSVRQKAKAADEAITALTIDLGREPKDREVAERLGIPIATYLKNIVDASWITVSMDAGAASHGEDDGPQEMAISDPDQDDITLGVEREELIGELGTSIRELPEREQLILSLYYKDELTMREVSKVLEISESRVCQLHARALTRLRTSMMNRNREEAA
ncbi:MAG: FliA/WhiG family RNA polymerase sigma factor [Dehalococcoidia bacterium]